jgi:hypothetical protein
MSGILVQRLTAAAREFAADSGFGKYRGAR